MIYCGKNGVGNKKENSVTECVYDEGRMYGKIGLTMIYILLVLFLITGCSSTELEERNFPLAAAITWDNGYQMILGFEELSDVANENANKENKTVVEAESDNCYGLFEDANKKNPGTMDYNHMKAIILSKELLMDDKHLNELLEYLDEQKVLARNTLLFVSGASLDELMSMDGQIKQPIGTYLDERIASDKELKDNCAVTLGGILNGRRNQNENLWIPELTLSESELLLDHYCLLQGIRLVGTIEQKDGKLALLSEQKLKQYSICLSDGTVAELTRFKVSASFDSGDMPTEHLNISAEAKLMNRTIENQKQQDKLKQDLEIELEEQLHEFSTAIQREWNVDTTNSYYRVGGYSRTLYEAYASDWTAYCRDLTCQYTCTIIPVSQ